MVPLVTTSSIPSTPLEVEENADQPGALQITLSIQAADNDLSFVNDARIKPFANIAVVVSVEGGQR